MKEWHERDDSEKGIWVTQARNWGRMAGKPMQNGQPSWEITQNPYSEHDASLRTAWDSGYREAAGK